MRAPSLLRPCRVNTTYVDAMKELEQLYTLTNHGINLPVDQLVATLNDAMLEIQQHVRPMVTTEVRQGQLTYDISLRWQSVTSQLQLMGSVDRLGLTFWLTNSLGSLPWQRGQVLAYWTCSRSDWSHNYGDLKVDRLERSIKGKPELTHLSTSLPVFEKVVRAGSRREWWQSEPQRPDLITDITAVTQAYASALS